LTFQEKNKGISAFFAWSTSTAMVVVVSCNIKQTADLQTMNALNLTNATLSGLQSLRLIEAG